MGRPAAWIRSKSDRRAVSYKVDFSVSGRRRGIVLGSTSLLKCDEARDRAGKIIVAARRGIDLTFDEGRGMPTFNEVWDEMIALDRLQRSPATIKDYVGCADRIISPCSAKG